MTLNQIERYEKTKFYFTKLVEKLDIIFCFGMLFTGLVILYLSYKSGIEQYGLGLAFSLGLIAYYLLKKKVDFKNINIDCIYNQDEKINSTSFLITNIVFWICFTLSIAILYNIEYIRPPLYFILVTLAFFAIFLEIFNIKNNGKCIYFIIFKILLISLSFRVGRYYSFATISGSDIHFHLMFAKSIIANGRIMDINADKYFYTPFWHVFEAINSIILTVNLKDTLFISLVAASALIISLFTYLIAKKLFNVKIGLIAVLFVNIADMLFVATVTGINPGTLVLIFFIITMFCLIQTKNRLIYSFFIILLIFESIITHQLSTFVFFNAMVIFAISEFLYLQFHNKLTVVKKSHYIASTSITLISIFFISMIFYWMNMSLGSGSFFDNMINRLHHTFTDMFSEYAGRGEPPSTVYVNMLSNYGIISNLMYNLGYIILFGLAIIGILMLLNRKYGSRITFQYICASIFLFGLIYPGTYIGLDQLLIPHRFLPFLELFLIIFAAFSVYLIFEIKIIKWNKIYTSVIVLFLIFFMITTPFINRNDAFYSTDQIYATDYTYSELKALEWGTNYITELLYVDPLIAARPLSTVEELNISIDQIANYPSIFSRKDLPHNVFVREYIVDKPNLLVSGTFGRISEVNLSLLIEVVSEKYNLIYSAHSGYIYQKDGSK